ncbi:hypothetical protein GCM10027435_11750 [Haloparvum alkalitolerans]|uniref:hypothetical protein n=1 Tax=Haloparvum alkalitolerans TaxID=1042953 RepID=UPI003CF4AEF0
MSSETSDRASAVGDGCCPRCADAERLLSQAGADPGALATGDRERGPSVSAVPDDHVSTVYELRDVGCRRCGAVAELGVEAIEGVSAATASAPTASVQVHYDPATVEPAALERRFAAVGYPVASRGEAFANRRATAWAGARFAAGIMAGLMALSSYGAVMYPARFEWLLGPTIAEHLNEQLVATGSFAYHLNIGVLAGIVLFFAGKPMIDGARAALAERSVSLDLAAASAAVLAYGTSWVGVATDAMWLVHFDVVVAVALATSVQRLLDASEQGVGPTDLETDATAREAADSTGSDREAPLSAGSSD